MSQGAIFLAVNFVIIILHSYLKDSLTFQIWWVSINPCPYYTFPVTRLLVAFTEWLLPVELLLTTLLIEALCSSLHVGMIHTDFREELYLSSV